DIHLSLYYTNIHLRSTSFPYTTLFRSLIIINILSTCFTAYYLTQRVNAQKQIIADQNNKLDHLSKFSGILEKYVNADDVEKLLRSEEHTSELQSREKIVCRLLREKKNI